MSSLTSSDINDSHSDCGSSTLSDVSSSIFGSDSSSILGTSTDTISESTDDSSSGLEPLGGLGIGGMGTGGDDTMRNSVEINIDRKNGKIIKSITTSIMSAARGAAKSHYSSSSESTSTDDEIHITDDDDESSSMDTFYSSDPDESSSFHSDCNEGDDGDDKDDDPPNDGEGIKRNGVNAVNAINGFKSNLKSNTNSNANSKSNSMALVPITSSNDKMSGLHNGIHDRSAMHKLLRQTMEQKKKGSGSSSNSHSKRKSKNSITSDRELLEYRETENDLHSQLVPIIIFLSGINIFAESASLARIVKFICTLVFFIALQWLEGNSAAKMIVKVGVSIVYLAAMFGHRINEWKECIDAETVLRKQQWSKQRDKERQLRKELLKKALRSAEEKRSVAKKQRKLDRETNWKQDIFDWRSRVRTLINHAESAFQARNWENAERYFSRLLSFLMENDDDDISNLLNERKRSNLKVHDRWKGVFEDHYLVPMAKMLSRRAYCLCSLPVNARPRAAPPNNALYCTMTGHLELAQKDLMVATKLRKMSPAYRSVVSVCDGEVDCNGVCGGDCNGDIDRKCDGKYDRKCDRDCKHTQSQSVVNGVKRINSGDTLDVSDIPNISDISDMDNLVDLVQCQLCDWLSLGGIHDLTDEFQEAYKHTLQADHLIDSLAKMKLDKMGIQLTLKDIIPLTDIEPVISKELEKKRKEKMNKMEKMEKMESTMSAVSTQQIGSGVHGVHSVHGVRPLSPLSVLEEMKETDDYPLRRKVDLSGYRKFDGVAHDVSSLKSAIDEQLGTIRLCMLYVLVLTQLTSIRVHFCAH